MSPRRRATDKRGATGAPRNSFQRFQQNIAPGCEGRDPYHASCLGRFNHNIRVRRWQNTLRALGPLDDAHAVTVKVVPQPEEFQLAGVVQAVEVEMIKVEITESIRLDQAEG